MAQESDLSPVFDLIPAEMRNEAKKAYLNVIGTKWKESQVVFETPDRYYKLYEDGMVDGFFLSQIRECIASVYQMLGVDWKLYTALDPDRGTFCQIESRARLRTVKDSELPYKELMLNWKRTLELVEDKLSLPRLARQMKAYYPEITAIKLMRECTNKYADYAWHGDRIILLDDADFFLAMVGKKYNWLERPAHVYDLLHTSGNVYFAPKNFFNNVSIQKRIDSVEDNFNRWFIYHPDMCGRPEEEIRQLRSERESMFLNNVRLLAGEDPDKVTITYTDGSLMIKKE